MPRGKRPSKIFVIWSWVALVILVLVVLFEATFSLVNAYQLSELTTQIRKMSVGTSVLLEEKARLAREALEEKEKLEEEMAEFDGGGRVLATSPDGRFVVRGTEQCAGTWMLTEAAAGPPSIIGYDLVATSASEKKFYNVYVQSYEQFSEMPSPYVQFRTPSYIVIAKLPEETDEGCRVWASQR